MPYKGELVNLIKWQNDELSRLGVEIRLSKDVTLDEIDTVVVAAGSRPVNQLADPLEELGIKVTSVGDAKKVRNGLAAVYEGYMAGYQC